MKRYRCSFVVPFAISQSLQSRVLIVNEFPMSRKHCSRRDGRLLLVSIAFLLAITGLHHFDLQNAHHGR